MRKKELLEYVPPSRTVHPEKDGPGILLDCDRWRDLFCVNVYSLRKGDLLHTVYADPKELEWITLDRRSGRWLKGMLNHLPDAWGLGEYYYRHTYKFALDSMATAAEDLFPGDGDLVDRLYRWQFEIHRNGAEAKFAAEQKKIECLFEACKPLPPEIDRWIANVPMKAHHYLYYQKTDRNHYEGWCSHCEKPVEGTCRNGKLLDTTGRCPNCGATVTFKSPEQSASAYCHERFCVVDRDPVTEILIVSQYEAGYAYRKGEFSTRKGTVARTKFLRYRAAIFPSGHEICFSRESVSVAGSPRPGWVKCSKGLTGSVYSPSLRDALKGFWEYCAARHLSQYVRKRVGIDVLISKWCAYPILESMAKAGYHNLIHDLFIDSYGYLRDVLSEFVQPGNVREIHRALGISRAGARLLRETGGGLNLLRYIKSVEESHGRTVSVTEAEVYHLWKNQYGICKIARRVRNMPRWYEYARTVMRDRGVSGDTFTRDYNDYLRDLDTLKLTGEKYLFPKDFQDIHFRYAEEAQDLRDEDKSKNIKAVAEMMAPVYEGSDGIYVTILPRSSGALRVEGKKMHHCVGGYSDKMARGDCVIVFIRKAEDPETPFVTAEFNQFGNCVQVRGKCNSRPDDETMVWFEDYKKIVKKKLEEQKRERVKRKNRRRDRRGDQSDQTADSTEPVVCFGGDRQTADRSQGNGAPRRMGAVAV